MDKIVIQVLVFASVALFVVATEEKDLDNEILGSGRRASVFGPVVGYRPINAVAVEEEVGEVEPDTDLPPFPILDPAQLDKELLLSNWIKIMKAAQKLETTLNDEDGNDALEGLMEIEVNPVPGAKYPFKSSTA